ncbi:MAG: carbamoyltransferase C-terminal domain-containing protein [Bacteroidota bacterium]
MKKNILGIQANFLKPDGIANESSVSLIKDGVLSTCIAEERLSRKKLDGQFPKRAIKTVLENEQLTANDIDAIAVPFLHPKVSNYKYLKSAISTFFDTGVFLTNKIKDFAWFTLYDSLKKPKHLHYELDGKTFQLELYDHHACHAAGAYYCSPFDKALVVTLDGGGDGLDGGVYFGEGTSLTNLFEVPHFQSPGTMYSAITSDIGFKRHRHEGKITGLAAYGNKDLKRLGLEDLMRFHPTKLRFISKKVAAHHLNKDLSTKSNIFYPLLEKFGREDLAAATQNILEMVVIDYVKAGIKEAKKRGHQFDKICLAGGVFANVKLNQFIYNIEGIDNVFVYPAMGDDGLSGGAALLSYYQQKEVQSKQPAQIKDIYKGLEFTNDEIKAALDHAKLTYTFHEEVEKEIALHMQAGKVVGRFNGKMEYGPRALGNRSIIGAPFDPSINNWLNKRLNRTEFMPFAPSINEEFAEEYFINYRTDNIAAQFMTITYDVNPAVSEKIPAVVHVDNTARPQVVKKDINPSYHKIIEEFYKLTGVPVVLNTSFNIHEQPIVCTPQDAIAGFLEGKLDVLAIGNFICL